MPRLTYYLLIPLVLCLGLFFGQACSPDVYPGRYNIELTKNIRNVSSGYYQVYFALADTARWEAIMAAADTIMMEGNKLKFRSDRIWYEAWKSPTGLRANQEYPGWERNFDTTSRDRNIMLLLNNERVEVEIPAADVVLDGDTVRIAIVHTIGPAFEWSFRDYQPQPDRLLLTTPGRDTMPIVLDMENIGPISRQTAFRVGKSNYVLRYVAEDYRNIEIERLDPGQQVAVTAELDLSYRQVAAKDLDGNPVSIKRTPGRKLLIYFWGGFMGENDLKGIDSLYHAMPQAEQEKLDIAVVSRFQRGDLLKELLAEKNIRLPVYAATEKTCLRLNCSPYLPYFVTVDERGKIVSFYDQSDALKAYLAARTQVPGR